MSSLTASSAPTLVGYTFAAGALLWGLLFWISGFIVALRKSATHQKQNLGLLLVAVGSVGFVACMLGVRWADRIAAHVIDFIG